MSKLDELIQRLCPNGVEYKTLGEIAVDIFRGSGITRDDVTAEGIPCVRYGEIYTVYNVCFDECVSHTVLEKLSSPKYFEHGDILFAITGESVEDIAKSCAYVGHERCLAGGDIVVLKHNQNPKYLAYALSTTDALKQKTKGKVKSKVVHSSVPAIKEIKVPVPPIEVQREIVQILDNFTELSAELSAELNARKKQFEYYSDQLFISDIPLEKWMTVEEVIVSLKTGLNPRQNFRLNVGGERPYITGKDIYNNSVNVSSRTDRITDDVIALINRRACLASNDVLFASTGTGTVGRMAVIDDYDNTWAVSETMFCLKPKQELINPHYLMYALYTKSAKDQFEPKISKGSVPHLKVKDLLSVKIPVPDLLEQKRIVKLMRKFDVLCNDISAGLPAEIEARQKQYEYYRDKLLTFKEIC